MANASTKSHNVENGIIRDHDNFRRAMNPELTALTQRYAHPMDPGHIAHLRETLNNRWPKHGIKLEAVVTGLHFTQLANPKAGYAMGIKLAEYMLFKCVYRSWNSRKRYLQHPAAQEILDLAKAYLQAPSQATRNAIAHATVKLDINADKPRAFNRFATATVIELHRGIVSYSLINAVANAHEAMDNTAEVTGLIKRLSEILTETIAEIQHPEGY